jgi:Tfp pilus assembly PilM family ATPase
MENESILGLAIGERSVQAVEVTRSGASSTVTAIDDWDNTLLGTGKEHQMDGAKQFADTLGVFLKANRVKAFTASVALDTSFMVMHTFPCEEGTDRADLVKAFLWELQQLRPDEDPKQFITDVHMIRPPAGVDAGEAPPPGVQNACMGVAVRRSDIRVLSQILTGFGLKVGVIDADQFSADTALRLNYPDAYRRHLALVGVKEHRVDVSILRNGHLEEYRYSLPSNDRDIADVIGKLARNTPGIQSIVTWGPYLNKDLLVQIRRASSILVEAMNPLRHVQVSDALRVAEHLSMPTYRFAAPVGVALRQD